MTGPIDALLDELVSRLSTRRPGELRSLLGEAEAHLRDDADAGVAAGLSPYAAEAAAVQRFGPVGPIVDAERDIWRAPFAVVVRQFVSSAVLLGGIAAVTIGVSGLVALLMRVLSNARFVVDTPNPAVLTADNCARWLGSHNVGQAAPGCRNAAMSDWVSEVVGYRIAVGVLGLIALLAFVLLRRVRHTVLLPVIVSDTIASGAFAVAGTWLLAMGLKSLVSSHGEGAGQWLSAAPVALTVAGVFGFRLVRDLRTPDLVEFAA